MSGLFLWAALGYVSRNLNKSLASIGSFVLIREETTKDTCDAKFRFFFAAFSHDLNENRKERFSSRLKSSTTTPTSNAMSSNRRMRYWKSLRSREPLTRRRRWRSCRLFVTMLSQKGGHIENGCDSREDRQPRYYVLRRENDWRSESPTQDWR